MALSDYVTLGNSGLRVSRFCLGGMTFGEDWGWGSSVAESEAIMARFRIAKAPAAAPAAIALACVRSRPGVASTIIGARRLAQLDENLAALDVALSPAEIAALDKLSQPTLNFPAPFLKAAGMFMHAGATVNGEPSMVWPLAPKTDAERY